MLGSILVETSKIVLYSPLIIKVQVTELQKCCMSLPPHTQWQGQIWGGGYSFRNRGTPFMFVKKECRTVCVGTQVLQIFF